MPVTDKTTYHREKALEHDARNKENSIRKMTLRVMDSKRAHIAIINDAWKAGLKVEFKIGEGHWQGDD